MRVKLSALIRAIETRRVRDPNPSRRDPDIRSLHYRAQEVAPGGLFVAVPGLKSDGHDFVRMALDRGAAALVVQRPVTCDGLTIEVRNSRRALAAMAAAFCEHPSERMSVIGITGTNGKTTTSFLLESMLARAGLKTGVIGTINYRFGGRVFENPVTTPESLDLQRILAEMQADGVTHVILEVSSHAIDLDRIYGCRFEVGIFTNLSQDHLDYHGDMEAYWACKKRFFTDMLASRIGGRSRAVINAEDAKGRELLQALACETISTGCSPDCAVRAGRIDSRPNGISGILTTPDGETPFTSALVGAYNLENILSAAGAAAALGLGPERIRTGIEGLAHVPGRLERIADAAGRSVYVDYAHSPQALSNVLALLRSMAAGRLICVFGCGGDRDQTKRPKMGVIAAEFSDLAIVTSDNPRTEAPLAIIDQIVAGIRQACPYEYAPAHRAGDFHHKGYAVEPDRRRAIRLAVQAARAGDTVLIAGKGHETVQWIGGQATDFDDRREAMTALVRQGHDRQSNGSSQGWRS